MSISAEVLASINLNCSKVSEVCKVERRTLCGKLQYSLVITCRPHKSDCMERARYMFMALMDPHVRGSASATYVTCII